MFKRFICGLSRPKEIKNYSNDKFYHVLLVLLLMVILYLIPVVYLTVTTEIVSPSDITQIKYAFNRTRDCEYVIEDYKLKYVGTSSEDVTKVKVDDLNLIFTYNKSYQADRNDQVTLIFQENGINYVYGNFKLIEFKYSDIEILNGIDFRKAKTNDEGFWTMVETIVYGIGEEIKPMYYLSTILYNVIMMLIQVLSMSLVLGFLYKINCNIKYGQAFKIAVISCVPYFLGSFFTLLFRNYLFNYIFLVYTLVVSIQVTNSIRQTRG